MSKRTIYFALKKKKKKKKKKNHTPLISSQTPLYQTDISVIFRDNKIGGITFKMTFLWWQALVVQSRQKCITNGGNYKEKVL